MTDNKPLHKILIIIWLLILAQGCNPDLDALPVQEKKIYLVHFNLLTGQDDVVNVVSASVYTYQRLDNKTELMTTNENMEMLIEYGDSTIIKTLDLMNKDGVDFINHFNGTKKPDSVRFFLANENDTLNIWMKPLRAKPKTKVLFKVDSGETAPHIQFQCALNQTGKFIGHRSATPVFTYPSMSDGVINRRFDAYSLDSLALGNNWYIFPLSLIPNPKRFDNYKSKSYDQKWTILEDFLKNRRAIIQILPKYQFDAIQALWQSQAYTYDPFRLPKNPEAYTDDSPFVLYIENTLELRSSP